MIFVLLHKIDMIEGGNLESIIAKKSQQVKNALKVKKLKIK